MAFLNRSPKSQRQTASPVVSLVELPSELRAAMTAVSATLDARKSIDEAIARSSAEQAQAQTESDVASEALTELDLSAALESDPAALAGLEQKIEAARQANDQAAQKVARIVRLRAALVGKAKELDGRLAGDCAMLQIETQAMTQQILTNLGAELHEAAKPLVAVLAKVYAATQALGRAAAGIRLFEEARLPSAVWGETPILAGSRYVGSDGGTIDLAAAWREDPGAAALAEIMAPVSELNRRIASHRDYRDPPPPPKVHAQMTQQSPAAIERARKAELENERRREEAEAARPRAQPRSWTLPVGSV